MGFIKVVTIILSLLIIAHSQSILPPGPINKDRTCRVNFDTFIAQTYYYPPDDITDIGIYGYQWVMDGYTCDPGSYARVDLEGPAGFTTRQCDWLLLDGNFHLINCPDTPRGQVPEGYYIFRASDNVGGGGGQEIGVTHSQATVTNAYTPTYTETVTPVKTRTSTFTTTSTDTVTGAPLTTTRATSTLTTTYTATPQPTKITVTKTITFTDWIPNFGITATKITTTAPCASHRPQGTPRPRVNQRRHAALEPRIPNTGDGAQGQPLTITIYQTPVLITITGSSTTTTTVTITRTAPDVTVTVAPTPATVTIYTGTAVVRSTTTLSQSTKTKTDYTFTVVPATTTETVTWTRKFTQTPMCR